MGLYGRPIGTVLRGSLAIAGRTGTLAFRMRHTGAAGRCQAKTGTLTGASNLAGYCTAADGLCSRTLPNDSLLLTRSSPP